MTIKDLERIGEKVQGDIDYYLEESAPDGVQLLYFRNFSNLIKFVKENYNDNLVRKEDARVKIIGVKIWRND